MKKLLLILPLLLACKTKKNSDCDAYGDLYIEKDTLTITTEHINYGNTCSNDTTITTYISDSVYISKSIKM